MTATRNAHDLDRAAVVRPACAGAARWRVALVVVVLLGACQRDADAVARAPVPRSSDGQRLHSGPGATPMAITLDQLRRWSEQLCTLPALDFAAALAALGISGSLVSQTDDYSIVEPPPAGTTRVGLSVESFGANRGKLRMLELTLSGAPITRGELDRRFGAGNLLPRVDYDRPHVVSYRVEIAGAPFTCTVLASFTDEPAAASAATKIGLRRDAVTP